MYRHHSIVTRHRKALLKLSNNLCHYCLAEADTADHIVPKADGGTDERSNLVPCCANCNDGKGCEISYAVFSRFVRRFGTPPKGWRHGTNKVLLQRLDDLLSGSAPATHKAIARLVGRDRMHLVERYRQHVRRSVEALFVPGGIAYAPIFSSPHGLSR